MKELQKKNSKGFNNMKELDRSNDNVMQSFVIIVLNLFLSSLLEKALNRKKITMKTFSKYKNKSKKFSKRLK